ncbi:PAS domain-containing sensor histidine kinase [Desulfonatronum thioautotrophicum]|uniref:PAS domain-containing sensor histidine kinase n=1 Tax=Desulfonatronum thioautotrophicum TaxID=617001 RepID=UPI00069980BB|nr:ATP-binding protein [Desulfonatronum thioautotrophicum]
MKNISDDPGHAGKLRQKAETILRGQAMQSPSDDQVALSAEAYLRERHVNQIELEMDNMELSAALSIDDVRRPLHELRVHQIELELQNEELRTAYDELDVVKARYYDLYNLAPVGYVTLSEPGLILEANLAAAALLGTDQGALATQPLARFIHKADQDAYYLHRKQVFKAGIPLELELRLVQADDGYSWVYLASSSARGENGEPVCHMVISDISKRKQAEEQLQRVLAEKDKLFSIIAHDLRSPLVGFVGIARLLASGVAGWSPNKLHNVFLNMKESAETLFNLLDNLLEWSSSQRGEFKHEPAELDWEDLATENTKLAQAMADQKTVALQCIAPRGLKVFADRQMLNIVVRNLISNAVKYSNPGGSVTIAATQGDGMVTISVQDSGIGMELELMDLIFTIGHKTSHPGTLGEKGSGLGLILCKEIVGKHGGQIRVESIPGQGSRFSFTLPAHAG